MVLTVNNLVNILLLLPIVGIFGIWLPNALKLVLVFLQNKKANTDIIKKIVWFLTENLFPVDSNIFLLLFEPASSETFSNLFWEKCWFNFANKKIRRCVVELFHWCMAPARYGRLQKAI